MEDFMSGSMKGFLIGLFQKVHEFSYFKSFFPSTLFKFEIEFQELAKTVVNVYAYRTPKSKKKTN